MPRQFALALAVGLAIVGLSSYPAAARWQHPATGHEHGQLERIYAGGNSNRSAAWDFGNIIMTDIKPEPETLSPLELYMVAGVNSSSLPGGLPLRSYWMEVWTVASRYYESFGSMPAVLDEKHLRRLPDLNQLDAEMLSVYRNPLTGEWPRLDAQQHSSGDFYIKPLSLPEMRYYAILQPTWNAQWFDGQLTGAPSDLGVNAALDGKVYYVKMYGLKGVLYEQFIFKMKAY